MANHNYTDISLNLTSSPTVIFITAKPLERDAVVAHIEKPICLLDGKNYIAGNYHTPLINWRVIVRLQSDQGNLPAIAEVGELITQFNPAYLFFVGVAGGIKKVKKGDVVVAKKVIGYEKAKMTDEGPKSRADVSELPFPMAELAQHVIDKKSWSKTLHTEGELPQAQVNPIASGDKNVSSTQMLQHLSGFASNAVALDMESIGFMQGLARHGAQGMVIRGISDFCIDKDQTNDEK